MPKRLRLPILAAAAAGALMASACTPVTKYQGFMVLDENPATAKVGEDTEATVRTKYGSPTTVSVFEPNIWYYMAQTTDNFGAYRPRLRARSIVAITFDEESKKVASVNTFDATDGRVIAYSGRETPTMGRQLSIWEQLVSTIGTTMLPPQDVDPGDLPGTIDQR